MSTITREFTKEQLQQIIETDHVQCGEASALARIALASLEAKSRKLFTCSGCGAEGLDEPLESKCHCNEDGAHWVESVVYTAPPAPVSVPEPIKRNDADGWWMYKGRRVGGGCAEWYNRALDDCRAAMLQGADGNSPVIPDGWVACSERMPKKNDKVLIFIDFNSEYVPPSIHDAEFTGSTFRRGGATVNVFPLEDGYGVTHWQPLPAAPQHEHP